MNISISFVVSQVRVDGEAKYAMREFPAEALKTGEEATTADVKQENDGRWLSAAELQAYAESDAVFEEPAP